jgi:hypothetical protein
VVLKGIIVHFLLLGDDQYRLNEDREAVADVDASIVCCECTPLVSTLRCVLLFVLIKGNNSNLILT